MPRTGPVAEAPRDERPIAPEPFEADRAELAREAAFARTLERASEAAQREVRISRARRVAPVDLDWGLR